ncbi:MAG: sulfurtransferase [Burkholderiales bacterium]|nr:sulfurtransferase [Burkholderiales bacterium]
MAMGHEQVAVLDGGLPAWIAAGPGEVAHGAQRRGTGTSVAKSGQQIFCDADFVQQRLASEDFSIVDARSAVRFAGTAPEPRAGLRGGHIPGSVNLPFETVLRDGHMRPVAELEAIFRGLPLKESLIFSCGSGVTACIPALAAELIGRKRMRIYEWIVVRMGGAREVSGVRRIAAGSAP